MPVIKKGLKRKQMQNIGAKGRGRFGFNDNISKMTKEVCSDESRYSTSAMYSKSYNSYFAKIEQESK